MARKKIVTLMLIAMFIHTAAAQDDHKPWQCTDDPTPENIFGNQSEQAKYTFNPADILYDAQDCTGTQYCDTTIVCAENFYNSFTFTGKSIPLMCFPKHTA
eukprot:131877_1